MDRLPLEVVSHIFDLASSDSRETAYHLCLVSKKARALALPVLYRHVCLSKSKIVRQFNATMRLSFEQLGIMIHGITLLDDQYIDGPSSDYDENSWMSHWKTLDFYLRMLTTEGRLSTLVLSREACKRFANYFRLSPASSKLTVDHLVVSHSNDVQKLISRFEARKLTCYCCELKHTLPILSQQGSSISQEIDFFIGDSVNHLVHSSGVLQREGDGEEDDSDDEAIYLCSGREWTASVTAMLETLSLAKIGKPKVSIYLHNETREAIAQLSNGISHLAHPVNVGTWGNAGDTGQRMAEMNSFADRGWIKAQEQHWKSSNEDRWCDCLDDDNEEEDEDWREYSHHLWAAISTAETDF